MTTNDTTAPTTDALDLAVWCRDRAHSHHVFETRELAMYPSERARDIALVEWTVRCLGNPNLDTAEEALRQIAAQHHLELNANGTAEWLSHRVKELTAELAETRAALDHANRELAGTRADLDSAIQANTAWANQTGQQPQVWAAPAEPTDVTAVRDRTGQLWVCPGRPGNNLWWRDVCGRGIGYEWHQLLQVGPLTPATAGVTA